MGWRTPILVCLALVTLVACDDGVATEELRLKPDLHEVRGHLPVLPPLEGLTHEALIPDVWVEGRQEPLTTYTPELGPRFYAGQAMVLHASIHNTSSQARDIVKPALHQVEATYFVEGMRDGVPIPQPQPESVAFCGVGNARKKATTIRLEPGERHQSWREILNNRFDVTIPGHYVFHVYHRYAGPDVAPLADGEPPLPPYELVSNRVEFDVIPSWRIHVKVIGDLERGRSKPLGEILSIHLENVASEPLEFDGGELFYITSHELAPKVERTYVVGYYTNMRVMPGQIVEALGRDTIYHGWWTVDRDDHRDSIQARVRSQGLRSEMLTIPIR